MLQDAFDKHVSLANAGNQPATNYMDNPPVMAPQHLARPCLVSSKKVADTRARGLAHANKTTMRNNLLLTATTPTKRRATLSENNADV